MIKRSTVRMDLFSEDNKLRAWKYRVLTGFLTGLFLLLRISSGAAGAPVLEEESSAVCISLAEDYINVRRSPSVNGTIIGKWYRYSAGTVLKETENGEWLWIRSGDLRGYVSAALTATGEEAKNLMEEAGERTAQVIPASSKVYDSPEESGNVVAVVSESTFLRITGEEGDWTGVITPYGMEGWIRTDEIRCSTTYSHAETLKTEEDRIKAQETAVSLAEKESSLWEEAREALLDAEEIKAAYTEAQMVREEAVAALKEGKKTPQKAADLKNALQEQKAAKRSVQEAEADAEKKIEQAQKASVRAQAAERVAIEATRLAPHGAPGSDFITTRDHTVYFEPSLGEELVNYACQFVGNPYVWGGESLTNGCDCSGFTMLVYAKYGITLPHFAQSQAAYGELIAEEDLQPGDLVFFQSGNYIYHVAIYIGNDTIVHAAGRSVGICFSNLHYSSAKLIFRRLLS